MRSILGILSLESPNKMPSLRHLRKGLSICKTVRGRDAAFVWCLWRTIRYEEVHLRAYASVSETRAGIGRNIGFHDSRRPHSSLDVPPPDQPHFNQPMPEAVAA